MKDIRESSILVSDVPAPLDWASYLINGDHSGLDPEELAAAMVFETELLVNGKRIVDLIETPPEDPSAAWRYGTWEGVRRDIALYTTHEVQL